VKTDSLFYRLFQTFPSIFFELINRPPEEANNYQFSSVEIKQTAFRIDGVFLPETGEENPIYFLEVQFQPNSEFYSRLFAEICLYLRQNKPENDWRAVVLYPNQSLDTGDIKHYREFFTSQRVRRIYLNQLGEIADQSIGVGTIKLVISPEENAVEQARNLINKVRSEIADELTQTQVLQLIETILVYKLPNKTQEEIEAMFGLSELKQTRVYQDAFREGEIVGKLATVPRLLALGLTVEQIAEALELDVEQVKKAAEQQSAN
jgi:predicted transposase/invertase (TIGR01784 family)